MLKRLFALCSALLLITFILPFTVWAQRFDPTPIPIDPGTILITAVPTLDPALCLTPLPIRMGQTIYIKSGIILRNLPTESGGIVWNTVYNNTNDQGQLNDIILNVRARVTEGPVCSGSLNWWRVDGVNGMEAPGWVAEGRPDKEGYFLIVPGATTQGCASIYELAANTTVDLLLNVKVRATASLDGLVLTVAPAGTPVEILDGGACVDNLKWWRVRVVVVGVAYVGWMTESDGSNYWLVPRNLPSTAAGNVCGSPLRLAPGLNAVVNTGGVGRAIALRSSPGKDAPLLFSLVDNVPLIIEEGPVCADNLNWWRVSVQASTPVIGWMAEGSTGVGFWIRAVRGDEFRYDPRLPDATATGGAPLPENPPLQPGS